MRRKKKDKEGAIQVAWEAGVVVLVIIPSWLLAWAVALLNPNIFLLMSLMSLTPSRFWATNPATNVCLKGGICGTVVARWIAGQQVERLILH